MFRLAGVSGLAMAAVVAAAIAGCAQKDARDFQPADAFGLEDASVVIEGNPSGLVSSKFFADITKAVADLSDDGGEGSKSIVGAFAETLGLNPTDVQRVISHADVDAGKILVVMVSKKPIDREAVVAALSKHSPELEKLETHEGVDILAGAGGGDDVLAFPEANLVVAGPKSEVKKGIDRLKTGVAFELGGVLAKALSAAPKGADLVVALVPTPGLAPVAAMLQMSGAIKTAEKIATVTITVKTADSLDLNILIELKTEKNADEIRRQIAQALANPIEIVGPPLKRLGKPELNRPAVQVIENIKVGGTGKFADIKVSVPGDFMKDAPDGM
jgi:hypothetical protein